MNNIILTTPAELESLVSRAVNLALHGQSPHSEPDFVSIDQAAELVNLSKNTLYGMVSRREVPFYKRGKKLYFKPAELREWIGSQKVLSRSELETELAATGSLKLSSQKGGAK